MVRIEDGAAQCYCAVSQQGPVRAATAVGHANAAGVDDLVAVREPDVGHVGVPADDGVNMVGQAGQRLGLTVRAGVGKNDFVVVAGCAVAEHDLAEAVDGQSDWVR
jgi:hypothetical protein